MINRKNSPENCRRPGAARVRLAAGAGALLLVAASCSNTTSNSAQSSSCLHVPTAVSSEKVQLLTTLAKEFARSWKGDGCVSIDVVSKSSGGMATALAAPWDESAQSMPAPVIWTPSSSTWGTILNALSAAGKPDLAAKQPTSLMVTPLVIAMPKPMAQALGWPKTAIGWSDILKLATDPEGWALKGHPEWGPFKLGKTNPNYSTSGLSALIAQTYAAAGTTSDLTIEDVKSQKTKDFSAGIESAVVHYGDITMTFLNNWYRADRRGVGLTYASAVVVEEKSVIDYNNGNPDGVLADGEVPKVPKTPLVAIYPTEGTLFSDNPLYVLSGDWVTDAQRDAATQFIEFVQTDDNQKRVLEGGFRPGNVKIPLGAPIDTANGVNPDEPQTTLAVPSAEVLTALLDQWDASRKEARVELVLDVSGSMGGDGGNGETKLELAQRAAISALDQFKQTDLVGLTTFTTDDAGKPVLTELTPIAPIGAAKERVSNALAGLAPIGGTPLYQVASDSFDSMFDSYDPSRINAVILLTDGVNDDGEKDDDAAQRKELLAKLRTATEGEIRKPVRIFTISYGSDADTATLREIAESTNGAAYQATDPTSIEKVFTAVVSNF